MFNIGKHLPSQYRLEQWGLIAILAAYMVWILSLPCFPSTDGPVHMYYVHILGALLSHADTPYRHYFHIRHILPPYSLYYYLLLLLSRAVPILVADRIVICIYMLSFVFGFRFLARAIGPRADLATLLATLLLLNWPLGMGFLSFCLSLSLALWAVGLWLRLAESRGYALRIGFVLLSTVTMLTHPVPLLLILVATGALFAASVLRMRWLHDSFSWPVHAKSNSLTWFAASLNLLYVRKFATAHPLHQGGCPAGLHALMKDLLYRSGFYAREHALSFLYGRGADLLTYRAGLLLLLLVPILAGGWQTRQSLRGRVWRPADTFFFLGALLGVLIPGIPSRLNDCFYFADRLLICVWIAFLLAFSGWSGWLGEDRLRETSRKTGHLRSSISASLPKLVTPAFAVAVLLFTAALLHGAERLLRPAAEAVAALEKVKGVPVNGLGFVMEDARTPDGSQHENISWNPHYWALVHIFRSNNAILANAPWMEESIIPVAPSKPLPEVSITALQQPVPSFLQRDLLRSPDDFDRTFSSIQFFVSNSFDRPSRSTEPLVSRNARSVKDWRCLAHGWYSFCYAPQKQSPLLKVEQSRPACETEPGPKGAMGCAENL